MARPYNLLRRKMKMKSMVLEDIAREFGCTRQTVSNKLRNVTPWTLEECWRVMGMLEIDPCLFYKYFPLRGRNE